MYLVKTPKLLQSFYKDLYWTIPSEYVYLSFDDGPDPEVTPWVLDLLESYDAKASFFVIGSKATQHPALLKRIRDAGHMIGNHSYSHNSGWATNTHKYLDDVSRCKEVVPSNYFRPPYGRLRPSQLKALKAKYKIIMWNIMSGDFDKSISKEKCLENVTNALSPGSIILFHDTLQSFEKLKFVLPRFMDLLKDRRLHARKIDC